MTCDHFKIQLIEAKLDTSTERYEINIFTYCNDCGDKLGEPIYLKKQKKIPNLKSDILTKTICNAISNGYEYRIFGHVEDRVFKEEHGDKWV